MGSLADHIALGDALERHDRDERVAELLRAAFAYELANRSYDRLCVFAKRCGFDFKTSDETVLQFARRRVGAFQRQYGRA